MKTGKVHKPIGLFIQFLNAVKKSALKTSQNSEKKPVGICDRAAPTHVGTLSSIIITTAHIHFSPSLISLSSILSTKLIYKGVTTCTNRTFENDYIM